MRARNEEKLEYELKTDIEYAEGVADLSPRRFDLYIPESSIVDGVLIYLHGGGWRHGDKRQSPLPVALAAEGIPVISADYALTTEAAYPRNIDDVFALIEFLNQAEDQFGQIGRNVFLGGSSAGGHLASLAVTKGLAESRLALPIRGVVSWYAPLDPVSRYLKHRYPSEHYPGSVWDLSTRRQQRDERDLFGPLIGTSDFSTVSLREALDPDPRFHLDHLEAESLPPFLLLLGSRDSDEIRYSQQTWFSALRSKGARAELLISQDADHRAADYTTPTLVAAVAGFISAHAR